MLLLLLVSPSLLAAGAFQPALISRRGCLLPPDAASAATAVRWTAAVARPSLQIKLAFDLDDLYRKASADEQASGPETPPELLGPWELRCTVSGMSSMWIELGEEGACDCSSRVGRAREWSAVRERGRWQLRFVLEDKLRRKLKFEAEVRTDELRGLVLIGSVRGPPKLGASVEAIKRGVVIGEFEGYKLE